MGGSRVVDVGAVVDGAGLRSISGMVPAIYQLTHDPASAAAAGAGTAIIASARASLEALRAALPPASRPMLPPQDTRSMPSKQGALRAEWVLDHLARALPADAIIAEEAPSHRMAIQAHLPIRRARSFFTMTSGGLGFSLPAAVGLALACPDRRVVAIIGDGSMMYSIQALYTAAQMRLPIVVVVLNNHGYGAMRAFSRIMDTPNAPGINLPGLDFTSLAIGHGCYGTRVDTADGFGAALDAAMQADGPTVIDVIVDASIGDLFAGKQ